MCVFVVKYNSSLGFGCILSYSNAVGVWIFFLLYLTQISFLFCLLDPLVVNKIYGACKFKQNMFLIKKLLSNSREIQEYT